MAKLIMDYYVPSDDAVSDSSTDHEILNRVREEKPEISPDDWAYAYRLSPLRCNIMSWYPFRAGCSILEIGADCGALTGFLAGRAGKLVSVEQNRVRANIVFERNRDRDNLEVIAGKITRLKFDEKFDYIVCGGGLQNAGLMIGADRPEPAAEFLAMVRMWLKEDGILLLATENRLGLKYLAGSREEHLGKAYVGIDGFREAGSVRSYSRSELGELCRKAGFPFVRWFFPYPDYRFPAEIFTDRTVNLRLPASDDLPIDADQVHVFDEDRVYQKLMSHGAMQSLSNSFFVEASGSGLPETSGQIDYVEMKYQCQDDCGCTRIWNFHDRELTVRKGNRLGTDQEETKVSIPEGLSFFQQMSQMRNREQAVRTALDELRDQLFQSGEKGERKPFLSIFGKGLSGMSLHWTDGRWLDLDARNLYRDGSWILLASQSPADYPVPAEFALWRMANGLRRDVRLREILTDEYIMHWLGQSFSVEKLFVQWEHIYCCEILGQKEMKPRKVEQMDACSAAKQAYRARKENARLDSIAAQSRAELYALAGVRSYRLANGVYRFGREFVRGTGGERKKFLKWGSRRRSEEGKTEDTHNPLLRIADKLPVDGPGK